MHTPRVLAVLAAVALVSASPALAQDSFGGSFGDGGGTGGGAQPPASTGGDFGGSFGEGGGGSFGDAGPGQPPASTGGDFGGSFGDSGGGGDQNQFPDNSGSGGSQDVAVTPPDTQGGQGDGGAQGGGMRIDPQILAFESRDFGIQPTSQLRNGQFHSPTPLTVPGATTLSTQQFVSALEQQIPLIAIDVLGGDYSLPGAYMAPAMASAGSFLDRAQQQTMQWLQQITGGDRRQPLVIYCSDPMCWLSYNASLRAVAAGYENVLWYRGGLRAWQMSGLPVEPSGF